MRKVLCVGECDLLVLDEILGLVDWGIINVEDVLQILRLKSENVSIILTGRHLPEKLIEYADYISEFNVLKDEM